MGYAGMLLAQVGVNVGMCLYVFPVVGLTLPFISYGGTSIVTMFAAMGIISSIKMRSFRAGCGIGAVFEPVDGGWPIWIASAVYSP